MQEQIASFLVDLVLAVLVFIALHIVVRAAKFIWSKIRTRKPKFVVVK